MAITPTKRELHSQETRKNIVDVAEKLFYQYGYKPVSVKEIAAAAGVTTGALYHHFKNKDDLIMAVFQRHDLSFGKLLERFDNSEDPIEDIVVFLSDVMVQRIEDDGMEFTQQRVLHLFKFDRVTGFDACLRSLIKRGLELDCFHPELSEDDLFDCLAAVYRGAVYQYCVSATPVDLRELTERRLRLTLEGVALSR